MSFNLKNKKYYLKNDKKWSCIVGLKLLRIEMNPQKIYSDWIADSNFIGFIKIWPLSE